MKYKRFLTIAAGACCVMSAASNQISATILYSAPSAIITQLDGYTVSCDVTDDGTIICELSRDAIPGDKDVNYITKDNKNFRHLEYNGIDYVISVSLSDAEAFVQEYEDVCSIVQRADGSYILCSKDTEQTTAQLQNSGTDILSYTGCISTWNFADATAVYEQICTSKSLNSARILQGHMEYTYDEGAYNLHLFTTAPVTAESFAFLADGLSVEIDADEKYPAVVLMEDGKPVDDYAQLYEFYCGILENIPEVRAVYPCYWYLQFDAGNMIYAEVTEDESNLPLETEETTVFADYTGIMSVEETTVFANDTGITSTEETTDFANFTGVTSTEETTVFADYTGTASTEGTTSTSSLTSETTTILPPENTTTTTDETNADLPQTGNNSVTNILISLAALLLTAAGAGIVYSSRILRRKEDEK